MAIPARITSICSCRCGWLPSSTDFTRGGQGTGRVMQLGMVGLGRMGGNMVERLRRGGHEVIGFDLSPDSGRDVDSLEALAAALQPPRAVWVMVPAGKPTTSTIEALGNVLEP